MSLPDVKSRLLYSPFKPFISSFDLHYVMTNAIKIPIVEVPRAFLFQWAPMYVPEWFLQQHMQVGDSTRFIPLMELSSILVQIQRAHPDSKFQCLAWNGRFRGIKLIK